MNKNVISIAPLETNGTTCLGGDLKVFHQFRCYGVGVATEIIAANSQGLQALFQVPFEFIGQQLESITADIAIHGAKLGAITRKDSVRLLASLIEAYSFKTLLFDPALRCHDKGHRVPDDVIPAIREHILPRIGILVVNAAECALLLGETVDSDVAGMKTAATHLSALGPQRVIVTGGHLAGRVTDVCLDHGRFNTVDGPRHNSNNLLGIGNAFSAAVLCQVVKGLELAQAVDSAKKFVSKAMVHPFEIGKGLGPVNLTVPV